jgi:hypothetical protein
MLPVQMKVQRYLLAVLLAMLLAVVNSEGRLQPTEQARPGVYAEAHLEQPAAASGDVLDSAAEADASTKHTSRSIPNTDSKQAAAVSLAGDVLQQLASQIEQLQEHLQQLHDAKSVTSPLSATGRLLLEDAASSSAAASNTAQPNRINAASATTDTTTNNSNSGSSSDASGNVCVMWTSSASLASSYANSSTSTSSSSVAGSTTQNTNARKIGSRVNLVLSDAWLITWSGLQILQACVQILGTLMAAAVDGVVTIDSHLVLRLVDLSTAFSSGVSYLLYSIFLLNSDGIAPWV